MRFSIITATYNRAHTLPRLYESLKEQAVRDFQWIVVDDGSSDSTSELVKRWIAEGDTPIVFIPKSNGGKHRAINTAMARASGDWTLIVDSDDWIAGDCLARLGAIIDQFSLWENLECAALITLSADKFGALVGQAFPIDCFYGRTFAVYDRYRVQGDKFDAYKTQILQSYPFPEIDGEPFVSEGIVWNRINKRYLSFFKNEVLQIVEYQADGLTRQSVNHRAGSPIGTHLYYTEAIRLDVSTRKRMRFYANLFRFAFHCGDGRWRRDCLSHVPFSLPTVVAGWLLYLKDSVAIKRSRDAGGPDASPLRSKGVL